MLLTAFPLPPQSRDVVIEELGVFNGQFYVLLGEFFQTNGFAFDQMLAQDGDLLLRAKKTSVTIVHRGYVLSRLE
jgi:hypothetical protein